MGDVVGLRDGEIRSSDPDEDVISVLEFWLERARAGEIDGLALTAHYRDNSLGTSRAGRVSRGMVGDLFGLAMRLTRILDDTGR